MGFFQGFTLRNKCFLFRLFLLEAPLGRYQYDPIGALHPIDGGTSVLEDFYGLNVHRVDGVDVRAGSVVHEDKGLSGRIEGILAPDLDRTVWIDFQSGNAASQILRDVGVGRNDCVVDLDLIDGIANSLA